MKTRILGIFITAVLFLIQGCNLRNDSDPINPPNIMVIVADDLGWNDVGFHGSEIKTPNIDRLATEGMELTRFYTAPVCSPTRAGLITGLYPDRMNLRNYVYTPRHTEGIPPELQTLPEMLKSAGYKKTAAFGKWHLGHSHIRYHPNKQGFDEFYGHYNGAIDYFTHLRDAELDWHRNNEPCFDKGYSTELLEKEVVRFLKEVDEEEPFFAYVAFNAPHSPMQAMERDLALYGYDPDIPGEDYRAGGSQEGERDLDVYGMEGRGNSSRQTYSGMVSALDRAIGAILQGIENNGLTDRTLIWFFSDNGGTPRYGGDNSPLRGAKHTEWEGGVRVVSLLRWPGRIDPGTRNDRLIAYIDVAPTLLNLTAHDQDVQFDGIDVGESFDGRSLPERYVFLGNSGIVGQQWKMNEGELFRINLDMEEKNDVSVAHPEIVLHLDSLLRLFSQMRTSPVELMQDADWKPPENWTMPDEE